jgi:hypothetical protein
VAFAAALNTVNGTDILFVGGGVAAVIATLA